jgi:hypothetical protein
MKSTTVSKDFIFILWIITSPISSCKSIVTIPENMGLEELVSESGYDDCPVKASIWEQPYRYFLIMMLGALAYYGKINSVPIDNNIRILFLYTGISHIVFGWLSTLGGVDTQNVN